jgi:sialidase-1
VVVTKAGSVLAFAEGRAAAADQAANDIILRRSEDGGRAWDAPQLVADDGDNSLNNPCAALDRVSGRVFVMFQSYPAGISERSGNLKPGLDGPEIVRNFLVWTEDDGRTWRGPRDVTATTKRPERVTTVSSGPGIGIQLAHGPHAGRLVFPFNEGPFGMWNVFAVFSDDHGRSWRLGEPAPGALITTAQGAQISQVNEVQMVERTDGSVLLNARRWAGGFVRKIATSTDGCETWSAISEDPALRDHGCQASIFRYTDASAGGRSRILFSGPESPKRENGVVQLSYDDGATWPVKKVLQPGSFGYSVLTALPDGTIGCLFEADNAGRIMFARFTLAWLTNNTDE